MFDDITGRLKNYISTFARPKRKTLKDKEESQKQDGDKLPIAGQLGRKKVDLFGNEFDGITDEELDLHTPMQQLSPLSEKYKPLSAATIRKNNLIPHMYANPQQNLDYKICESLLKHTFVGALAKAYVKYLVGRGFKPELELVNPDEDDEKNQKLIDEYQELITGLRQIDDNVGVNENNNLTSNFQQKIFSLVFSTLMYNRGGLMHVHAKPVTVNGKEYPAEDIPSDLIFAPAQDLGIIEIDPETRNLKKVQWRHEYGTLRETKHMVYLWNIPNVSTVHNSEYYGSSILTPLIAPAKLIRTLASDVFPAMSKNAWAGLYYLIVKNEGNTTESKRQEYNTIARNTTTGAPNIIVKDPEHVKLENVDYDAKISELRELFESMVKLAISVLGLPQVGFYDEAAANRSTMVGKIQLTMRTTIEPEREWIGQEIVKQWYLPNAKVLLGEKFEKFTQLFRIKLSWTDLHISEWYDQIESVLELDARGKLKNAEFGELTNLDNYESMLDPDAEIAPGGSGGSKMSMTDSETGNKFEIKSRPGDNKK